MITTRRFVVFLLVSFVLFGCQLVSNVTPAPTPSPMAEAATSVPTEPVAADANEEAVAAAVEATIAAMPTQPATPTNTPAPTETAIQTETTADEVTSTGEATATAEPTETVAPAASCTRTGWRNAQHWPGQTQFRGFDRNTIDILAPTPIDASRLQIEKLASGMWLSLTEHSTFADAGDIYFDVQIQTEQQQGCIVTTLWFGQGHPGSVRLWLEGAAFDHFDGWAGDSNNITIP